MAGIIHPDEFQQSIANINRARRATLCQKISILIMLLCLSVGVILIIVGASLMKSLTPTVGNVLLCTGIGIMSSSAFMLIFLMVLKRRRVGPLQLRDAINFESMKYSTKLPVPTKWQLRVGVDEIPNGNKLIRSVYLYVSYITSASHVLLKKSLYITGVLRRKILISTKHDYQNFK